jgi:hypothetical protein
MRSKKSLLIGEDDGYWIRLADLAREAAYGVRSCMTVTFFLYYFLLFFSSSSEIGEQPDRLLLSIGDIF